MSALTGHFGAALTPSAPRDALATHQQPMTVSVFLSCPTGLDIDGDDMWLDDDRPGISLSAVALTLMRAPKTIERPLEAIVDYLRLAQVFVTLRSAVCAVFIAVVGRK